MAPTPPQRSPATPPLPHTTGDGRRRPIHTLIIERDAMARLGVRHALSASADITVLGAVGTVQEACDLPARTPVDVILVGATVRDLDETDGIAQLLTRFVRARVALFSEEAAPAWVVAALRAGADGVLSRSIGLAVLARAVRDVAQGEVVLPRALLAHLVAALRLRVPHLPGMEALERLSPRERQIAAEVAVGRSNAEIALRLGLKENTVKTHVSNILAKTGARSRHVLSAGQPHVPDTA